ncbi:MAG: type III PLP-dependent enzyme, partial [Schwartzia sp.]|nr:type III PLP-dependent enzyme [Schwartzia sp. (in: firmicutes)]
MKSFRLTEKEMVSLAKKYPTPFVVVSLEQVAYNYRFMREHMPMVNVFYAMKANPSPKILDTMVELGASFDTASAGEIETLHKMGVPGERMIYANPVKTIGGLKTASQCGVRKFIFDDASEIAKMAEH